MANIFIFHGVGGHPQENWFPWLNQELTQLGHQVIVPQFPTPEGQTLEHWLAVLQQYRDQLNSEAILIGHSLGVPFTLNVLERYSVRAAYLVAGFVGKAGNQFDDSMATFAQREFAWEAIKKNCSNFTVFHSDNDPYIPLAKAEELAKQLNSTVTLVPGAGHFNSAAGYQTFPLLLEQLRVVLNQ